MSDQTKKRIRGNWQTSLTTYMEHNKEKKKNKNTKVNNIQVDQMRKMPTDNHFFISYYMSIVFFCVVSAVFNESASASR